MRLGGVDLPSNERKARGIRTYIVDSFADRPVKGNPAGVCIVDEPLSDALRKVVVVGRQQERPERLAEDDEREDEGRRVGEVGEEISGLGARFLPT